MHRRLGGSSGIHGTFLLFGHAGCFIGGDFGLAETQVLGFFHCFVCIQFQLFLFGHRLLHLGFFGGERVAVRSLSSSNFSFG